MPDLVVRGGSLAFPKVVLSSYLSWLSEVACLPFPEGGHFELSSALLSFFAYAQMLVTELGSDHAYLIGYGSGSQ